MNCQIQNYAWGLCKAQLEKHLTYAWMMQGKESLANSPRGRSSVLEGVLTMGKLARARFPRRKPVEVVSASDMIPESSLSDGAL